MSVYWRRRSPALIFGLVLAALVLCLIGWLFRDRFFPGSPELIAQSPAQITGSVFLAPAQDPWSSGIAVEIVPFPRSSPGSIWGATGRDAQGRVWIGVSDEGDRHSARLYELDTGNSRPIERGDALRALSEAGLLQPRHRQAKIHSKIAQGADGALYFATMDEHGERPDGSRLPHWGGHLWRYRPGDQEWEHLLHTPEALIAVCGSGRWIYALGYWDHVLYQYDVLTGEVMSKRVGSAGGHVSRNIVCTPSGRVYVPRIEAPGAPIPATAFLVELDRSLRVLAATPLLQYAAESETDMADNHGIVGLVYLADGSILFVTHRGYLYKIMPADQGSAQVRELGWLHPEGEAYCPSLFTFAGERFVAGVARRPGGRFEWVVRDLEKQRSKALPLPIGIAATDLLLYGSVTRDDQGAFYLVGRYRPGANAPFRPMLLRVTQSRGPRG